ncbi:MAG: MraY family glycosyltransferase [Opitutales bacterium]
MPDQRRIHKTPIPRLGGIGIAAGFFTGVVFFAIIESVAHDLDFFIVIPDIELMLGAALMLGTGIYDDLRGLRARQKLFFQAIAATVIVFSGYHFNFANYIEFAFGWDLAWIDYPISIIWILAIINALNLIDGLDGLAGGTSVIVITAMTLAAALNGYGADIVFVSSIIGALFGFLAFNRHPASIFMGDSGSLFLGFLLATFMLPIEENAKLQFSLLVPVLALGLPILDTSLSIIRRMRRGQGIFTADRDHIHHRMMQVSPNYSRAVNGLYTISFVFGLGAIVMATLSRWESLLIASGIIFIFTILIILKLGYFKKADL